MMNWCVLSVVLWERDGSLYVLNIYLDERKFPIFFFCAPLFFSWSKKELSCLGRWIQSLVSRQNSFLVLSIILLYPLLHEHLDCLHQNSSFVQKFVQTVAPTCSLRVGTHKDAPIMNCKWWNGIYVVNDSVTCKMERLTVCCLLPNSLFSDKMQKHLSLKHFDIMLLLARAGFAVIHISIPGLFWMFENRYLTMCKYLSFWVALSRCLCSRNLFISHEWEM